MDYEELRKKYTTSSAHSMPTESPPTKSGLPKGIKLLATIIIILAIAGIVIVTLPFLFCFVVMALG